MKILVIGDFHGRFPARAKKEAEKADLIIAIGDYANADKIRKIIFKHWTDKPWYEVVGMKKARQMEKESFNSGLKILKELNNIGKPVYLIWGNTDFYKDYRVANSPVFMPGFYEKNLKKLKNLILFDKKNKNFLDLALIGFGGYLDPTEYVVHPIDETKKAQKQRLANYKQDEKRLKKLFARKRPSNNFIFATHYPPIKSFDIIKFFKKSPMYGKSAGWKPYNEIIKKYSPRLVLCGHMHEYQGKKMLGKSLVVNPGCAAEGKFAVVDWESLKVKFYR